MFQVYLCGSCKETFCLDCDITLHETVHTCPGCASNPVISQMYATSA